MAVTGIFGICICLTNLFLGMSDIKVFPSDVITVFLVSGLSYFLPGLVSRVRSGYIAAKKEKELLYLKKMFLVAGSVKPADYLKVIRSLTERAVYYKEDLAAIMEMHRISNSDKRLFYKKMITAASDMDTKLFIEKLEIADCHSFEDAMRNIRDDFFQQKRILARKTKKRIELIHIVGVVGMFLLITVLMLYLLGPWLKNLDVGGWV